MDQGLLSIPGVGKTAESVVSEAILAWVNSSKVQKLDKESLAAKEIIPGSEFLNGYNGINRHVPQDVEYATFYGDIHAEVKRKFFNWDLSKKISIGDGLILPESATGIPTVSPNKFAYSEEAVFNLKLKKADTGYALSLELPNVNTMKAIHTFLLDRTDLRRDLACQVLGQKTADVCK